MARTKRESGGGNRTLWIVLAVAFGLLVVLPVSAVLVGSVAGYVLLSDDKPDVPMNELPANDP